MKGCKCNPPSPVKMCNLLLGTIGGIAEQYPFLPIIVFRRYFEIQLMTINYQVAWFDTRMNMIQMGTNTGDVWYERYRRDCWALQRVPKRMSRRCGRRPGHGGFTARWSRNIQKWWRHRWLRGTELQLGSSYNSFELLNTFDMFKIVQVWAIIKYYYN